MPAGRRGWSNARMDRSSENIVDYADTLRLQDLSGDCLAACKTHLLDSIGCALGGYDSRPGQIARAFSKTVSGRPGARVFGDGGVTSPDGAAFANAAMRRD